ncbi:ATP-binding protein [Candidatus Peregrinibacteria bacterium]|nr:ATP-binding protein [Candidatus Peregrinibacteria bacterium]
MKKNPYIPRDIENLLKKLSRQFPAIVVTGPRQSGKSTLLKKLFAKEYAYFSFDDPLVREQAKSDPNRFLETLGGRVIIDEIQYVPELLSYIKIRIDENRTRRGQFIFTGSQQFPLIKHLGDSLAGRIAVIELLPFSVREKKKCIGYHKGFRTTQDYYLDACIPGSFPEIVLRQKEMETDFWYGGYLRTYLERDVRSFYNIGNLREFQRFLQLLAARCSQILNLSSLAADTGVAVNTIKNWISILEAGRIIYLLPPYYNNLGKRITKSPKVYFLDCGLLAYLLALRDRNQILQGPLAGPLFENFCIQETVKFFLHRGKRDRLYYVRMNNGLEVDLLLEGKGKLYPLEFKLSKTPHSSMVQPIERFRKLFKNLNLQEGALLSLSAKSGFLPSGASFKTMQDYFIWLAYLTD